MRANGVDIMMMEQCSIGVNVVTQVFYLFKLKLSNMIEFLFWICHYYLNVELDFK